VEVIDFDFSRVEEEFIIFFGAFVGDVAGIDRGDDIRDMVGG
jgi:hypothetical protein